MDRITNFSILGMKLEGFKRFKEPFEIKFDKLTYISGGNGQGKTTVADAIAYAFCCTPFWGEAYCERLHNPESKIMSVDVQLVDQNGEIHRLVRQRDITTGNNTVYFDNVQIRQSDMANIFAERDVFLSVFNPLYFIERLATDGRTLLQKLLPPVRGDEVLKQLSEPTRTLLEGQSLLDPECYMKNKRAQLREDEETCTYYEGQIDLLKAQQKEATEKIDSVLERGNEIVDKKTALEEKQFRGIDIEALKKKRDELLGGNSEEKRTKLLSKQAEVQNRQYDSKFTAEIAKIKAELESLTKQYKRLAVQIKSVKVGDQCPTCRTVVTSENHGSIISEMKKELAEVLEKGKGAKSAFQELLEIEEKSKIKFEEFRTADLARIETELAELKSPDSAEIETIENQIRLGNLSEEEYAELTELTKQAENYAKEVEMLCEADRIPEKIAEIEKSMAYTKNHMAELQKLIQAAKEFTVRRTELTLSRLKMNRAAIKLYDVVKSTGEVKDTFKFTYDGKDYRWLSTSEKIKAGLEVSELLQRLTGLVYPTYIDNAECITTKLAPVQGLVILAYARNTEFAVHHPLKKQEKMKEAA